MGIEPTPSAWKAEVLPLSYTRLFSTPKYSKNFMVVGEGFEPSKLSWQNYSLLPLTAREPLRESRRALYTARLRRQALLDFSALKFFNSLDCKRFISQKASQQGGDFPHHTQPVVRPRHNRRPGRRYSLPCAAPSSPNVRTAAANRRFV